MEDDDKSGDRPWAKAFDLILSEYPAYDDEKILNLTPGRLMQMVEMIQLRRQDKMETDQKMLLAALQVHAQSVTGGMMATVQSKQGGKWLADYVKKMRFLPHDEDEEASEKELPSTAQVMAAFGADPHGLFGKRG